jgi:hypothetical protein
MKRIITNITRIAPAARRASAEKGRRWSRRPRRPPASTTCANPKCARRIYFVVPALGSLERRGVAFCRPCALKHFGAERDERLADALAARLMKVIGARLRSLLQDDKALGEVQRWLAAVTKRLRRAGAAA